MKFDLSIVIVNYNVKDALDNCLASIYKANTYNHNLEIIVVDNNSFDGSTGLVAEKYPDVILIKNSENIGFSKANNIAIKKAVGEYLLILNPDTVLEEGTYKKIIDFIKSDKRIGIVTSKLIMSNGEIDIACRRSFPTISVALPRILGLSKIFPKNRFFGKYNLSYLDENSICEVDAVNGAFMFMKKSVLNEVGLFDEDYFMYGEDIDLCYRVKMKGYNNYYFPEVKTIHLKGESTRKTKLSYVNNFYGAMSIFVRKNLKGTNIIIPFLLNIGITVRSSLSYLKRIIRNLLIIIIDILLIFSTLVLSVKIRFNFLPQDKYLFIIIVYIVIWMLMLLIFGVYQKKNNYSLKNTFSALVSGFFINSSITYFFKDYAFSREVVLTSTVMSIFLLLLWRAVVNILIFFRSKNITLKKINLLLIGEKKLSQNLEDHLISRYNISYYHNIFKEKNINGLEEYIKFSDINEVLLVDDVFSNKELLSLMYNLKGRNVVFKIVPSGKDIILSKLNSKIDDLNLIEIEYNINKKINIFLKRLFDLFFAFLMIITVYPILFIYHKTFKKKLLKHTSKLMDLPMVFIGKYSLVGMPVWYCDEKSGNMGKKGLSGIVQLHYEDNLTSEEIDNYILYYAKNQNVLLDLEILLKTLFSFLNHRKKLKN